MAQFTFALLFSVLLVPALAEASAEKCSIDKIEKLLLAGSPDRPAVDPQFQIKSGIEILRKPSDEFDAKSKNWINTMVTAFKEQDRALYSSRGAKIDFDSRQGFGVYDLDSLWDQFKGIPELNVAFRAQVQSLRSEFEKNSSTTLKTPSDFGSALFAWASGMVNLKEIIRERSSIQELGKYYSLAEGKGGALLASDRKGHFSLLTLNAKGAGEKIVFFHPETCEAQKVQTLGSSSKRPLIFTPTICSKKDVFDKYKAAIEPFDLLLNEMKKGYSQARKKLIGSLHLVAEQCRLASGNDQCKCQGTDIVNTIPLFKSCQMLAFEKSIEPEKRKLLEKAQSELGPEFGLSTSDSAMLRFISADFEKHCKWFERSIRPKDEAPRQQTLRKVGTG